MSGDGAAYHWKWMKTKYIKLWCGLLVMLGVLSILSILLIKEGRKFSVEVMFSELNSIAPDERDYIEYMTQKFQKELQDNVIDHEKFNTEVSILKSFRQQYVCIDKVVAELFSESQKEILEKSLRSFYADVYWGRDAIPEQYKHSGGFIGPGVLIGYRAEVYPGVVRINFYKWRGMIGNGGGGTIVYLWNGSVFRRSRYGASWVT